MYVKLVYIINTNDILKEITHSSAIIPWSTMICILTLSNWLLKCSRNELQMQKWQIPAKPWSNTYVHCRIYFHCELMLQQSNVAWILEYIFYENCLKVPSKIWTESGEIPSWHSKRHVTVVGHVKKTARFPACVYIMYRLPSISINISRRII